MSVPPIYRIKNMDQLSEIQQKDKLKSIFVLNRAAELGFGFTILPQIHYYSILPSLIPEAVRLCFPLTFFFPMHRQDREI
ncbi:hypothetical protein R0J91_17035, partial [Micrococcus sp. SIMBA_131]